MVNSAKNVHILEIRIVIVMNFLRWAIKNPHPCTIQRWGYMRRLEILRLVQFQF